MADDAEAFTYDAVPIDSDTESPDPVDLMVGVAPADPEPGAFRVQSKRWCFTWNNPTGVPDGSFYDDLVKRGTVTYLVFGHERGDSGTYHLQGYIEVPRKRTFPSLNNILHFPPTVHWEVARGTGYQASEYCKKGGHFEEFGHAPAPTYVEKRAIAKATKEKNWEALQSYLALHAWDTVSCMPPEHQATIRSNLAYFKRLQTEAQQVASVELRDVEVYVFWGPTGTGKTYKAFQEARKVDPVPYIITFSSERDHWMDNYNGQKAIILDEFDHHRVDKNFLKRLLDRYSFRAAVKGSFTYGNWTTVYITSNIAPDAWYLNEDPNDRAAIMRRLKHIEFMGDSPPVVRQGSVDLAAVLARLP